MMKFNLIATAALFAALTANSAHAIVHKTGVIKSVNMDSNTVVLIHKNGHQQEFRLAEHTKIVIEGKEVGIDALAPNQQVRVALPSAPRNYIKAQILEVDLQAGLALVKPVGAKDAVSVRLNSDTKVLGKVSSLEELVEGQMIKFRYAGKI